MRTALDEGQLGRLALGDAHTKWYRPEGCFQGWKGTKRYDGGGALMNQGMHTIDLLQWMMGEVATVCGYVGTLVHDIETEDVGVAVLRFSSGAFGIIAGSTSIYPGLDERLGICEEEGSVEIESNRVVACQFKQERKDEAVKRTIGTGAKSGGRSNLAGIGMENHRRQLREIVKAILEEKEPPVDGNEAKKSAAIIEAIYKSNRTGRPVALN